jgi:hypothetical protein
LALDKTLHEVFVEGESDRRLLAWAISNGALDLSANLKRIDAIEVPSATLVQLGLENNNRGRVIAVVLDLLTHGLSDRGTGVVDQDFDWAKGSSLLLDSVLRYDYAGLELYTATPRVLHKFCTLHLGRELPPATLPSLQSVLTHLYLMRAANVVLGWNMRWVSYQKLLHMSGHQICLNRQELVSRYLQANGRHNERSDFDAALTTLSGRLPSEPRLAMRGHDLVDVLFWYCGQVRSGAFATKEGMERTLMSSLEVVDISSEPFFGALRRRCRPDSSFDGAPT